MGRSNVDEKYLCAFNAAVSQREQILQEFERLKSRRILVEEAARALEPVVYPGEYMGAEREPGSPSVIEIPAVRPNTEIWNPTMLAEAGTDGPRDFVHGDAEPEDAIQRRISMAIGRSAAD